MERVCGVRKRNFEVEQMTKEIKDNNKNPKKQSLVKFLQDSPLDEIIPYLDKPQNYPRADWTKKFAEILSKNDTDDAKEFSDWNEATLSSFDENEW